MRRRLAGLFVLALAWAAAGCGDQDKGSVKADKTSGSPVASSPDAGSTQPLPFAPVEQKQSAAAEQLKDAVGDRPVTPATAKVPLDRMFDGNRAAGQVADPGAVGAPTQAEINAKAQRVSANLADYRNGRLKSSGARDQPKGGTLPPVPLPDPRDASGEGGARGGGSTLVAYAAYLKDKFGVTGAVFSRAFWGASRSTAREGHQNPTRVTIHHTDGRQTMTVEETRRAVKGIQEFHQGPDRGWGDIGYHFLVDGGGNVFEGRHADVIGAHVLGHNLNNIGIANLGDYNRDKLTDAQKTTLKRLIVFLALKYKTDPKQAGFIEGHHHFQGNDTDCPGKNIDAYLPELRMLVDQDASEIIAKGGGDRADAFRPLLVSNDPSS